MRRNCHQAVTELRRAIDGLPGRTREAMLEGIGHDPVITGAYKDRDGGVCPMLAAHRRGARADFVAFAGAWDRLTGVNGQGICRRATPRELEVLAHQLEESLDEGPPADLGAAVAEHQALTTRLAHEPPTELVAAVAEHPALTTHVTHEPPTELVAAVAEHPALTTRLAHEPPTELVAAVAEHPALTTHVTEEAPTDLGAAVAEHQALARARREREASGVGLDWLHGGDAEPPLAPVARARRSPVLA